MNTKYFLAHKKGTNKKESAICHYEGTEVVVDQWINSEKDIDDFIDNHDVYVITITHEEI